MLPSLRSVIFAIGLAWLPMLASAADDAVQTNSANPDYLVNLWGADEGMPMASVTDVAQTPDGYLWCGTLVAGLMRFDGVNFVSFTAANIPEIQSEGIHKLAVDQAGRLWINTLNNALVIWDSSGFQSAVATGVRVDRLLWSAADEIIFLEESGKLFRLKRSGQSWSGESIPLPELKARQVCADAFGRVWYLRTNNVLAFWHQGKFRTLESPLGLEGRIIRQLAADRLGQVWVGTDQTLARWQEDRFVSVDPGDDQSSLAVKRIIPAGSGSLWVEANGRMRRLAEGRWVAESFAWKNDFGKLGALQFVRVDSEGGIWTGARDSGLIHLAPDGAVTRLTTRDGLPSNSLLFASEDRQGNIWSGYARGGLIQVRPRLFRTVAKPQGLSDTLVSTVCQDADGAVWIGTHSGTVVRWQEGNCTSVDLPAGMASRPTVVTADAAGRKWIAVPNVGLMVHESGNTRLVADKQKFSSDIRLLFSGSNNVLWIGNFNGIWTYKDEQLKKVYSSGPGAVESPAAMTETADGTIWAGTFGGFLLRWDGTRFNRSEPPERQSLGRLWSLCADKSGGIWIGSSRGGLLHWRGGEFRRYTMKQGLPSDCIVQVMSDAKDNLWLDTTAGIVRVDAAAFDHFDSGDLDTLPVSVYGREDGLLTIGPAIEFQPNCWRAKNGELWFAMANGVASVNPDSIRIDLTPPSMVIEEIRVNGMNVWPSRPGAVFAAAESATAEKSAAHPFVKVGPGRQDLDFRFTGLSLGSPFKVRFKYLLEGLDQDWSDVGDERAATYRSVPPGEYRFLLMACNRDGQWSEPATLAQLEITPHFYETAWFQGVVLLGVIGGGSGFAFWYARWRARRRMAELKRQGAIDRERARIAQDLHDDLGSDLTEISFLGAIGRSEVGIPPEVRTRFDGITQRARNMTRGLDEIVWAVNPSNDSLASTVNYVCSRVLERSRAAGVDCHLDVAAELPVLELSSDQRHNLLMAVTEAVTNVIKHSQAAEIWLRIHIQGGGLMICVEDNGRGMESASVAGERNGLANMRHRCEQLGGKLQIESLPGSGTKVTFRLPLKLVTSE